MLNNKILGISLIILAIAFLATTVVFKIQIDKVTALLMAESGGSCIQDGKCIHQQSDIPVYSGIILSFITLCLGIYLTVFARSQENTEQLQKEIVDTIKETKKQQNTEEKFEFLFKALSADEKLVLEEIKKSGEITQDSLRLRLNWSKAKMSTILTNLDKTGLIQKERTGKTYKVYLQKNKK